MFQNRFLSSVLFEARLHETKSVECKLMFDNVEDIQLSLVISNIIDYSYRYLYKETLGLLGL